MAVGVHRSVGFVEYATFPVYVWRPHGSMTDVPSLRAILFDLDDTLLSRARSIGRYAAHFRESFAPRLDEVDEDSIAALILAATGDGYRPRQAISEQLSKTLPWRNSPEWQELDAHWRAFFPASAVPTDDHMQNVLAELRRRSLRLGIVTNGPVASQSGKIDTLRLRALVDAIVISDEIGVAKPDRRIFEHALDQLDVPAASAWFVGDHPINDVVGARGAGLTGIWMRGIHPWPPELAAPTLAIDSISDVLRILDGD